MATKLFNQVSGTIAVSLKGKNTERIINMALARGIFLWDIRHTDTGINCKVRNTAFEALKNIAEENRHELIIIERRGLPFYRNIIKTRMGFITGALIFVLALYLMSSFVWFINVSGNHQINTNRILLTAAKYGVYQGAAKWNFSRSKVEKSILQDISELAYVQLDIRGVRANIKVVEKILPPHEITGPCNIVARKGGVVENILVLEGQASTQPGQVVAKGDILISGIILPEPNQAGETNQQDEIHEVRARGTVKARVWYEGYGECKLRNESKVFTGRKRNVVYLHTPWKNMILIGNREEDYPYYTQKENQMTFSTPVGEFGLCRIKIKEQAKKTTVYTEAKAIEIARGRAMRILRQKMGETQRIANTKVDLLSSPSDNILRVRIAAEKLEDIAVAQQIHAAKNSN